MIQIIVFSYNRAMQLNTLLKSVSVYWKQTDYKLTVIYNTTVGDYEKAYKILIERFPAYTFVKESKVNYKRWRVKEYLNPLNIYRLLRIPCLRSHKTNFRNLVNQTVKCSEADYLMFLTDDSLFINGVILPKRIKFIDYNKSGAQLSLRHNPAFKPQCVNLRQIDNLFTWSFDENSRFSPWGYRFSVDAHIYSLPFLRKVLRSQIFNNPTTLETSILSYMNLYKKVKHGYCLPNSCAIGYELNSSGGAEGNSQQDVSLKLLNEKFLLGFFLEYEMPVFHDRYHYHISELYFLKNSVRETLIISRNISNKNNNM